MALTFILWSRESGLPALSGSDMMRIPSLTLASGVGSFGFHAPWAFRGPSAKCRSSSTLGFFLLQFLQVIPRRGSADSHDFRGFNKSVVRITTGVGQSPTLH